MIHLVIDTSIFRSDPSRRKVAFRSLLYLGKNKKIKLHVPYVVEHEFKSYCFNEYEELFNPIESGLKKLQRKRKFENLKLDFSEQLDSFKECRIEVLREVEKELDDWFIEINANKYQIISDHTQRTFEAYFQGKPPFSTKKSREDIPDAFIFETVKDLSEKYEELIFVCADKRLRTGVECELKIRTHSSLDEFVLTEECKNLLSEQKLERYFNEYMRKQLEINSEVFEKAIEDNCVDSLVGQSFGDQDIPDDEQSATINSVGEAEKVCFDFDDVAYYGNGIFLVPFSFQTEVLADYFIFKSEYACMEEEKMEHVSISDWNEHYFAAEENFYVRVEGRLSFEINTEKIEDEKELREILKMESFSIDSIDSIEVQYCG